MMINDKSAGFSVPLIPTMGRDPQTHHYQSGTFQSIHSLLGRTIPLKQIDRSFKLEWAQIEEHFKYALPLHE